MSDAPQSESYNFNQSLGKPMVSLKAEVPKLLTHKIFMVEACDPKYYWSEYAYFGNNPFKHKLIDNPNTFYGNTILNSLCNNYK